MKMSQSARHHALFFRSALRALLPALLPAPSIAWAEVAIPFQIPRDGRASLALYDREGQMVRTLLTGRPLAKGAHTLTWDGVDRYGRAVPAGDYTWKLVATEGLRAEFLMQVGQNAEPVWERATGNHTAPNAVAVDATGLYRLGAENEGAHWGVKTDLDGRHVWTNDRWSADPSVQKTAAVTLVGGRLFELMPNGHIYGYDAMTGRVFTGGDFDPKPWNGRWEGFEAATETDGDERRKQNAAASPRFMAGDEANGWLVLAFPQHDAVVWLDAQSGQRLETVRGLPKLAGLSVAKDGTVLAISQGAVVALSRESRTPRVVVAAEKLQSPWRLSVSMKSGDIFVAENSGFAGAAAVRRHQVKRFSAAGALIQSFGKAEGRGDGVYVATDFRGITDIKADADGGFVITEGNHTPPRRTARFSADGTLLREWFGAQHYGVIACPEPGNPRFVWTLANAPQQALVRWEVDYAAKSWRVAEVYQDVFAANPYALVPQVPQVFAHGGRIYIQGGALHGGLALVSYDAAAKRIRPCAASDSRENKSKQYLWCDLNDDGLATDDEVQWLQRSKLGGWVNPADFALRTTPVPTDYTPGPLLRPVRLTPGGTPIYDGAKFEQLSPWQENGVKHFPGDYRIADDGSVFACFSDGAKNPHEGAENHGAWYYNSCSAIDRLVKWSRDGRPLWSVGRHSPDNDHETGSTAMPRGLVGLTHGCVVWGDASDEETARPTVWTDDGLYVDELLRVPGDTVPKRAYGMFNANEYPMGHLHTDVKTGEVFYYALNSGGGAPIYRITGWDGWHRAEGKITLSTTASAVAKRDGTGVKAEYFNNADCSGAPALTRTDQLIYFNWGQRAPDAAITADEFSARWSGTYEAATSDDMRFEIRGSFPWRDKGRPQWAKLWLGGQLVFDSTQKSGGSDAAFNQDGSSVGTVRVRLKAGERIALRLACGFKKGEAAIALSHDTPSLDRRAVLPEFLYPAPGPEGTVELVTETRPPVLADIGFEETSGVLSRSKGAFEVFGRLTGNTRRVPGKVGQGIELNAGGPFAPASFPIDEELRLPDTNYRVSFWFKTTADNLRLCEATRYSSYNNRWSDHVIELEKGRLRFALKGDQPLSTTAKLNDGQWHHVITTVGPGGQQLHVDGQHIANGRLPRRTQTSNRLGLDLGPGDGTGVVTLDELRVEHLPY
jgi:mannan endo-1,4-beta-mannosidase